MKNILLRYYHKNKRLLLTIAISTLSLLLTLLLMGVFVASKPETIIAFFETNTITQELLPFSILSIVSIVLVLLLVLSISFLFIKGLFPSKKIADDLMMKDDISFLIDLPNRIGKEVFKNGE